MSNPRGNEYGTKPKFEVGDRVRVWRIFRHPEGIVEDIIDENSFPIKYLVSYTYHDGRRMCEVFESQELTIVERRYQGNKCDCGSESGKHSTWCRRYYPPPGKL